MVKVMQTFIWWHQWPEKNLALYKFLMLVQAFFNTLINAWVDQFYVVLLLNYKQLAGHNYVI